MYSRPREDHGIPLPGDYCGTAFREERCQEHEDINEKAHDRLCECGCREDRKDDQKRREGSIFSDIPILKGLGSLGISMPTFCAEDILIIATAAFLFFSKSGDKECAIMLLLLIFIAN